MLRAVFITVCALITASCASTQFEVIEVTSLASTEAGNASFKGLESLARSEAEPGKPARVNILFLHGIGWVENPDDDPLANNFIAGMANAYGMQTPEKAVSSICGRDPEDETELGRDHIFIQEDESKTYATTIPGSTLTLDSLVCMDRQILRVEDDLEFVIYRIFWDDIFWQSLQFAHIGQDDNQGSSMSLAGLRAKYNRNLKDQLVNFGVSDAVMYLGPAGKDIRDAVRGAMCSAALDAGGFTFERQGDKVDIGTVCGLATENDIDTAPFAFVTESLGSKIAYDIMRWAMSDGQENIYDDMIKGTQFYMLANQIALLSLADISQDVRYRPPVVGDADRPTIVALSEVNDFLTYELVPHYEQLYTYSDREDAGSMMSVDARADLIDLLGFNIVDMRVQFADPLVPFVGGLVDPIDAHNGHVKQPELMKYLLCGAMDGEIWKSGCAAAGNLPEPEDAPGLLAAK